VSADGNVA